MSNNTTFSARKVLEQLQKLDNEGVDLTKPLNVCISTGDRGDFLEHGAYELYQPSLVKTDLQYEPCLIVEPVGGA